MIARTPSFLRSTIKYDFRCMYVYAASSICADVQLITSLLLQIVGLKRVVYDKNTQRIAGGIKQPSSRIEVLRHIVAFWGVIVREVSSTTNVRILSVTDFSHVARQRR